MPRGSWVFAPDTGGTKIPKLVQQRVKERIERYAAKNHAGKFTRLGIRFHGALCYIDAFTEPAKPDSKLLAMTGETEEQYLERLRNIPVHLCRLRYHGDDNHWSVAFFTYGNDKYTTSVFPNGSFRGTPEEAFAASAMYLQDF